MANDLNKDALLEEITRRVIQLDSQRQFDAELNRTINAYIEALDEITTLGKSDIEAIAQQVINEYHQQPKGGLPRLQPKHWLIAGAALLGLVVLMAIFVGKYFGLKEGLNSSPADNTTNQVNNRAQIIRAKLAQVFVQVAPLKVAALEHYLNTLKFPNDFAQLGYKRGEFEDGSLVEKIEFTPAGGILIYLGSSFDAGAKVLLLSDALENNAVFKWRCTTTLPQHYLGPTSAAPCEHSQDL